MYICERKRGKPVNNFINFTGLPRTKVQLTHTDSLILPLLNGSLCIVVTVSVYLDKTNQKAGKNTALLKAKYKTSYYNHLKNLFVVKYFYNELRKGI